METKVLTARFQLGNVVATPVALKALGEANQIPTPFLMLHQQGNWGLLGEEDCQQQNNSLKPGRYPERLMSVWTTATGAKFWIITEWDRSVTTILLPEEY